MDRTLLETEKNGFGLKRLNRMENAKEMQVDDDVVTKTILFCVHGSKIKREKTPTSIHRSLCLLRLMTSLFLMTYL